MVTVRGELTKEKWQPKKDGERKKRETGGKDKENRWGRESRWGWTRRGRQETEVRSDLPENRQLHGHKQEDVWICCVPGALLTTPWKQSNLEIRWWSVIDEPSTSRSVYSSLCWASLLARVLLLQRRLTRASRDPFFLLQLPKPFFCLCATKQGRPRPQISNATALPWLCLCSQIWLQSSHFVPVTRL